MVQLFLQESGGHHPKIVKIPKLRLRDLPDMDFMSYTIEEILVTDVFYNYGIFYINVLHMLCLMPITSNRRMFRSINI